MTNFKNTITSKIISFTALVVFLLNTAVYGIDLPNKSHLRPSLISSSQKGKERLSETATQLDGRENLKQKIPEPTIEAYMADIDVAAARGEISYGSENIRDQFSHLGQGLLGEGLANYNTSNMAEAGQRLFRSVLISSKKQAQALELGPGAGLVCATMSRIGEELAKSVEIDTITLTPIAPRFRMKPDDATIKEFSVHQYPLISLKSLLKEQEKGKSNVFELLGAPFIRHQYVGALLDERIKPLVKYDFIYDYRGALHYTLLNSKGDGDAVKAIQKILDFLDETNGILYFSPSLYIDKRKGLLNGPNQSLFKDFIVIHCSRSNDMIIIHKNSIHAQRIQQGLRRIEAKDLPDNLWVFDDIAAVLPVFEKPSGAGNLASNEGLRLSPGSISTASWALAKGDVPKKLILPGTYMSHDPISRFAQKDIDVLRNDAGKKVGGRTEGKVTLDIKGEKMEFNILTITKEESSFKFLVPAHWGEIEGARDDTISSMIREIISKVSIDYIRGLDSKTPYIILPAAHILDNDYHDHLVGDCVRNNIVFLHGTLPGVIQGLNYRTLGDKAVKAGDVLLRVLFKHELDHEVTGKSGDDIEKIWLKYDFFFLQNALEPQGLIEIASFGIVSQEFMELYIAESIRKIISAASERVEIRGSALGEPLDNAIVRRIKLTLKMDEREGDLFSNAILGSDTAAMREFNLEYKHTTNTLRNILARVRRGVGTIPKDAQIILDRIGIMCGHESLQKSLIDTILSNIEQGIQQGAIRSVSIEEIDTIGAYFLNCVKTEWQSDFDFRMLVSQLKTSFNRLTKREEGKTAEDAFAALILLITFRYGAEATVSHSERTEMHSSRVRQVADKIEPREAGTDLTVGQREEIKDVQSAAYFQYMINLMVLTNEERSKKGRENILSYVKDPTAENYLRIMLDSACEFEDRGYLYMDGVNIEHEIKDLYESNPYLFTAESIDRVLEKVKRLDPGNRAMDTMDLLIELRVPQVQAVFSHKLQEIVLKDLEGENKDAETVKKAKKYLAYIRRLPLQDRPVVSSWKPFMKEMLNFIRLSRGLSDETAHFSLLSKNGLTIAERNTIEPTTRVCIADGKKYDINEEAEGLRKLPLLLSIPQQQTGINSTFNIRGPDSRWQRIIDYFKSNPQNLKNAIERSKALYSENLPDRDIDIVLADRYDFLAGDHRRDNLIILNASDIQKMIDEDTSKDKAYTNELVASALSEELAHERGARRDDVTEQGLAKGCAAVSSAVFTRGLEAYINFVRNYAGDIEGQNGYLGYLNVSSNALNETVHLTGHVGNTPVTIEAELISRGRQVVVSFLVIENPLHDSQSITINLTRPVTREELTEFLRGFEKLLRFDERWTNKFTAQSIEEFSNRLALLISGTEKETGQRRRASNEAAAGPHGGHRALREGI